LLYNLRSANGGTVPRLPALISAVICLVVSTSACKQHSKDEEEPQATPPPVATASAAAVPTATAEPIPSPEAIPPPVPPPAAPAPAAPKPESLKACCAALHKEEGTVKASEKSLYQTAAASCDAIAKLVTAGTTKKSAALVQLRANLKGGQLPPGCN
jgi:hypothetical protein